MQAPYRCSGYTLKLAAAVVAYAATQACSPLNMESTPSRAGEIDPLVGCYQLEIGRWEPERHPGNAPYQTPPAAFRLFPTDGDGTEQEVSVVRPVIPTPGMNLRTPSAAWLRAGPDSVRIDWTNEVLGVQLRMGIEGDSLKGNARAWTDNLPPPGSSFPRAPAVARRISCSEAEL
jgi:hypothetical protein